jgi:alginate O-acetyltransferase complex protein AlgJ
MGRSAELIADALLSEVQLSPEAPELLYEIAPVAVRSIGDIAALLKLPRNQTLYRAQSVMIQQVQTAKGLWRPTAESEILLLGDSFSNIYSLAAMGWGESGGLAEQLSYDLNRPIDCILQNSDGAFATRETLSRELARGRDRLAGKKVVIWEFAERELMFGNWKLLSMALGEPKPAKFYSEPPPDGVVVTATVRAMTFVPRPRTVPYKDHIFSVHLEDIEGTGQAGNVQAIAYLWSMRENLWTPAARWRPGDRVKLRLTPWPGTHPEREKFNRSDFLDPELSLEEKVWADVE